MDGVALVVGEALIDVVVAADGSVVERPGGSAANAAVALSRLMRPVLLATSYGPDEHGRLLSEHLVESGVVLATEPHVVGRTSVARARVGADGGATYDFDVVWALGPVTVDDVQVMHVSSLAPVLEPGAAQVLALVDRLATTTVTYDLNVRPAITGTGPDVRARVERMAARADLVKASDEDLAALWPEATEDTAVQGLLELGAGSVVVTRGATGAEWIWGRRRSDRVAVAAPAVDVIDTIGAGDTFGAGLLDAVWEHLGSRRLAGLDPEARGAALTHAAACAAVTVSRVGADPPWRREVQTPT
ncbi:carbohydrate kinase [Nocardioides immobilis]|uniref:Carbohydrate kinase n=1 Tax=Nocardioides immobilis TaxID=2049295 RepID=A0A417XVG9_9ACTN|nr:PfkB family carbohydrate kinase [Nocardioides immobilis]RHW24295.1 carbohydrate kinase [Nocardioides immobilis]